jgi:hypothetical protein
VLRGVPAEHLVLAGTARGEVTNREVRRRRLCPPDGFLAR